MHKLATRKSILLVLLPWVVSQICIFLLVVTRLTHACFEGQRVITIRRRLLVIKNANL